MSLRRAIVTLGLAACCTPPPTADAPRAPEPPKPPEAPAHFGLTLSCHQGEHLADVAGPASPPPSPIRWFGQEDDTRRHANIGRRSEFNCRLMLLEELTRRGSLSRQLFKQAEARAVAARCLLRVMRFGDPFSGTFDRPFIPPLDGAGRCAEDEALVLDLRESAESLFARAYEARAPEPDACTAAPTLAIILHEQAFLALARGDYQRADSLYARIESTCPSLGHAPLAALRRADVAYEAALAGERGWAGVDEAYARVEQTCRKAPATSSPAVPSETVLSDTLRYPASCERIHGYVRWKRPFVLLSAERTDEANELFRALVGGARPRPRWLLSGWWCSRLDEDVLRWGANEPVSCTTSVSVR